MRFGNILRSLRQSRIEKFPAIAALDRLRFDLFSAERTLFRSSIAHDSALKLHSNFFIAVFFFLPLMAAFFAVIMFQISIVLIVDNFFFSIPFHLFMVNPPLLYQIIIAEFVNGAETSSAIRTFAA